MDTLEVAPQVLDGRGVSFSLPGPLGMVECVVTIRALQDCFWLEPHADDIRILRAFRDGYGRIRGFYDGLSPGDISKLIVDINTLLKENP